MSVLGGLALLAALGVFVVAARRPSWTTVACLAAAVAGAVAAAVGGAGLAGALAGSSGGLVFPALTTLVAAVWLADAAAGAGADRALGALLAPVVRRLGPLLGARVVAIVPLFLDIGEPAGARRLLGVAGPALAPRLVGIGASLAAAGGAFGGAIWLVAGLAGEAAPVSASDPLWLVRLSVWPGLIVALNWMAVATRPRPDTPPLPPFVPGPPGRAGWAALTVVLATAAIATWHPDPRIPVEAMVCVGILACLAVGVVSRQPTTLLPAQGLLAQALPSLGALAAGGLAAGALVTAGAGDGLRNLTASLGSPGVAAVTAALALAPGTLPLPAARAALAVAAGLCLELGPTRGGPLDPAACVALAGALGVGGAGALPRGATATMAGFSAVLGRSWILGVDPLEAGVALPLLITAVIAGRATRLSARLLAGACAGTVVGIGVGGVGLAALAAAAAGAAWAALVPRVPEPGRGAAVAAS